MTGGRLQHEAEHGRRPPQRIDQRGVAVRRFSARSPMSSRLKSAARLRTRPAGDPIRLGQQDVEADDARLRSAIFRSSSASARAARAMAVSAPNCPGRYRRRPPRCVRGNDNSGRTWSNVHSRMFSRNRTRPTPEQQQQRRTTLAEQGNRPSPRLKGHRSFFAIAPGDQLQSRPSPSRAGHALLGQQDCQLLDRRISALAERHALPRPYSSAIRDRAESRTSCRRAVH